MLLRVGWRTAVNSVRRDALRERQRANANTYAFEHNEAAVVQMHFNRVQVRDQQRKLALGAPGDAMPKQYDRGSIGVALSEQR